MIGFLVQDIYVNYLIFFQIKLILLYFSYGIKEFINDINNGNTII